MVFHWSLSDSKSPQVSRTRLSILAVLNNAAVWMVSTQPPTSKSSSPQSFNKSFTWSLFRKFLNILNLVFFIIMWPVPISTFFCILYRDEFPEIFILFILFHNSQCSYEYWNIMGLLKCGILSISISSSWYSKSFPNCNAFTSFSSSHTSF